MPNPPRSIRAAIARHALRILRALVLVWLALVILVGVFQRRLIYFPSHAPEPLLLRLAGANGMQPWRDSAGTIIGWRSSAARETAPANRLLVFHGNAGYALDRDYYLTGFERLDAGRTWEVFLFEYPGYGARPGELGQPSFDAAAHAAFETLTAADARPIFVLGESLGSGPACILAAREPQRIAGICLVTPFRRLADVAAHHYPWLPVRWILRDRWDNAAALAGYRGRLAMRIAAEDEIIPTAQARQLYEEFTGPKRLWIEPDAGHNGLNYDTDHPWWRQASDFLLGTTR